MKKKILLRSLLGAPIGVTISLIITVIVSLCLWTGEYYPVAQGLIEWCGSETTAVIVQLVCSLFIGAVSAASSVVFDMEKWNLLKQTLVHFAVLALPFFGVAYIMFWMPHEIYGALGFVGAFVSMYIIMWCSMYFSIKAKIKKMNMQLQQIQREDTESK